MIGTMYAEAHLTRQATATHEDWRDRARCRNEDPELFFPVGPAGPSLKQTLEAKNVCAWCPVMLACRDWALQNHPLIGIWGGLDEDQRKAIKAQIPLGISDTSAIGSF